MIARVFQQSTPAGPGSDEVRKRVEEGLATGRQADGCEGMIYLRDTSTGEALAISLWRDQTTADAYSATSEKITSEIEQTHGYKSSGPHVYSEVTALL